jgi:MFS family permease
VILISATVNTIPVNGLVAVFLSVAFVMGAASGVRSLAFKDMLGRILPIGRSSRMLFVQSSIAGIVGVAVAVASLVILAPGTSAVAHQELIWLGIALLVLSAVAILAVREPAKTKAAESEDVRRARSGHIGELRSSFRIAFALSWFRRFLLARTLFLSIELAMPFYSIHAATYHGDNSGGLYTFVIASSLGLVLGGLLWPRFGQRSIRLVLAVAAIVTFAGGALALTIELKPDLQSPFIYSPVFVLVAIGTQGIGNGRTLYLSEVAGDHERPFCIAVSSALIGAIAVGMGAILGILANLQGVAWPILTMIGLNFGAALFAMTLGSPHAGAKEESRAPGMTS